MKFQPRALSRLQPLGRALMLPIAVLPIAALLLRLGQPDMLEPPLRRGGRQCDLLEPRPALRGRRRGRPRAGEPRRGLARRRRSPIWSRSRAPKILLHAPARHRSPRPPPEQAAWQRERDRQAQRARRHRVGHRGGPRSTIASSTSACPIISPSSPAAASCRSRRGWRGLVGALLFGLGFPWFEAGVDTLSRWSARRGAGGPVPLRAAQPAAADHRAASHHQQHRLVLPRRLPRRHRRHQALLRRRSDGRYLHVWLLPGDDVRPARRLPRHVSQRPAGAAQGGRAACCSASRSPPS